MAYPQVILFTSSVLAAASDSYDDLLDATHVIEEGVSSWPRFYLDCADYTWLTRVNFVQAYFADTGFESRVERLVRQFLRVSADSPFPTETAIDFAKQIASVFHQSPICCVAGSPHYRLAMQRCQLAGSLRRTDGIKPYVLTCDEQLQEWLAGRPMHNYLRDECCPDFSCCSPDMLSPPDVRQAFVAANDEARLKMLSTFLSGTASNFYVLFPPLEDA